MTQYAAYLGIDWADKKHDLCLVETATGKQTKQVLAHTPQAIADYFTNLRSVIRTNRLPSAWSSRVDHCCLRFCRMTF